MLVVEQERITNLRACSQGGALVVAVAGVVVVALFLAALGPHLASCQLR